jgi:isocitrate lyase
VADAEAGFGGVLNAFELMKAMIEAGAAGVHFEDQLAAVKKCGHMGGKVLVPTRENVAKLVAARLAADVMGVPTVVLARTDAEAADLVTSDVDDQRQAVLHRRAHRRRLLPHQARASIRPSRAAWPTPSTPTWCGARPASRTWPSPRQFADAIHAKFPGKLLAYNCSPSFNWKKNLDDATIAKFQRELGAMGYKFQFITLAGFHSLNYSMFNLAYGYARNNMSAFVELQEKPSSPPPRRASPP